MPGKRLAPIPTATAVPNRAEVEILQFDQTGQLQRGHSEVIQIAMSALPNANASSLTFNLLTDLTTNGQGAPVLYENRLAGLVMSQDETARVVSIVPYPVLAHFLKDASEKPYKGFASAGFVWKKLVDPAKRAYLKIPQEGKGVLVLSRMSGTGASTMLKPNDVILGWDGYAVDNLGYYKDPDFGRLQFSYLIKGRREPGDTVPVQLVRNGTNATVRLPLSRFLDDAALIPENVTGRQAEYLVEGGFIIRELTGRYLRSYGSRWQWRVDARLVSLYMTRKYDVKRPGDRVVILSGVLPDPINMGYQRVHAEIITSLNGKPIRNMADVFRIMEEDGHITRLALLSRGVDLVLAKDKLTEANARLAKAYRIPTLRFRRAGSP
jgi:hypothetical protein